MRQEAEVAPYRPYSYEGVTNHRLRVYLKGIEPEIGKHKKWPIPATAYIVSRFSPSLGLEIEDVYKIFEQVRRSKVIELTPRLAANGRITHYLFDPLGLRAFFALCWTIHEEQQDGRRMYLEERVQRVRIALGDDPLKEWLKSPIPIRTKYKGVYNRRRLDEDDSSDERNWPDWEDKEVVADEEEVMIAGIERRSKEVGRVLLITDRSVLEIASRIDRELLVFMYKHIPNEWTEEVSFRKVPFLNPDLVRMLGFNAMARLGRIKDFDFSLEDYISYQQLRRWVEINIRLFDENPPCKNLAELFDAQKRPYLSSQSTFVY